MNDTTVFNFNGQPLNVLHIEGEPWFALTDINRILYGQTRGMGWVVRKLDEDEQRRSDRNTLGLNGGRQIIYVSESGLYKLIMRSDKETAAPFQKWVTKEVLPSIRKTGGYLLNEDARPTAHADTKETMPLPEGFAQMFQLSVTSQTKVPV